MWIVFKVIDDKVLIELMEREPETQFIVPDGYRHRIDTGCVVNKGEEVKLLTEGDIVYIPYKVGSYINIKGINHVILTEQDIKEGSYIIENN